ncbi:MAG: histidine kinase [Haliscomenobacter sp.]|uniref:sensor histidine kinase n=1 Tax=Haliscomenobacter sp. TaxID=2717303 RepID=UPI0029AA619B|nr:histidine kinase [Haliscomenobacter sp.]MDX2070551.1 histidine kinase [Haliscomenobacter sp.]
MKNGKKILKIEFLVCIHLLILSSSALFGQKNPNIERDTFKHHFIQQVKPYLNGVSWVKDLVRVDTARSFRNLSLAPLTQIDENWMQSANCDKKVPKEWIQYWSAFGTEPTYDILPYYFFHKMRICHIFGFMSKDSIGIIWGMVNFDTTVIVLNKREFGPGTGDDMLNVYPLVKQYHFEPQVENMYERSGTEEQELPKYLQGKYYTHSLSSSRKEKLMATINDSMVHAANRWWKIQYKSEIDVKRRRGYRIFATDINTQRPGYFVLREKGPGGRKWSLSLTIESSPNAAWQDYFELGEKELKDPMQHFRQFIRMLKLGFFFILLTVALIIYFLFTNRKKRRQQQQTQLSLAGLRAQLNPHFLFNTLTSIQDLMNQDNKVAANRYFNEMAQLLRYVVDSSVEETTNVASEVAALEKYCSLEALRTPFDYRFDIRPELDLQNIEIPTMLLQPFVENAILHGLRPSSFPKELCINMWPEGEDRIGISIVDNGIGIEESRDRQPASYKRSHQGISTTQKRIELLNIGKKQKIVLEITDRSHLKPNQTGTLVQLSIPI